MATKFCVCHLVSLALCWGATLLTDTAVAQSERTIVLDTEKLPFTPKGYFWAEVSDQRSQRVSLGRSVWQGKVVPTYLDGTLHTVLGRWLKVNRPQTDSTLIPIRVVVKELVLNEKALSTNKIEGKWQLNFAFERIYEDRALLLTEYSGGVNYTRPANSTVFQESSLAKMLAASIVYFNNWMAQNLLVHPQLAQRTELVFLPPLRQVSSEGDTVFYEHRGLTWGDFQRQPPPATRFGAAVYTSFAYEATSKRVGSLLQIALRTKVFMIKSNSWARASAKDAYSLRHEQLHFDITQLIAERFKQKLASETLPLDDYDSRIQYLFLESFREMNRIQQQYDAETSHSLIRPVQAQWIERIERELRALRRVE